MHVFVNADLPLGGSVASCAGDHADIGSVRLLGNILHEAQVFLHSVEEKYKQ